uniref:SRCR domain-containing protein n=1 Tax=Branchiostoma floridae TaxID=7739 RepID=C3ZPL1_BRAFL|eukprot:XP_002589497.1 hypothetical protein BRAFLDRAFT_88356 [Branchiostoma floridae]
MRYMLRCEPLVPLLLFITVFVQHTAWADPCTDYQELNQARRSAAAEVDSGSDLLCDNTLSKGWYRFISYVGGEIPTTCVEPYHCGTQVPIWMNGTLPTDSTVVNRTVCPNYGVPGNCCPFPWNIQVKRCVDTQGVFYVYELVPTTSCSQAYCAGGGHFLSVGDGARIQPLDTAGIISPVIVPSISRPCNVIIQGAIGNGKDAVLAIDDISFSWDCVREVDGSVRLVDGARFDEGRVEIYYNHRWGTICNIGWTQTSADVVCAQLGYRASVWTDSRYPAPNSTPILLDEVICDSRNKSKITDCRTKPWENWSPLCNHARDVSVRCVGDWHQCRQDAFVCTNQVCLPKSAECDFSDDCGNGSDESDCGGGHFLSVGDGARIQPLDTAGIISPVIVPSISRPCNVIIQGGIGNGKDAVLAIDDISFSWDCVREVDGSVRLVDGSRFDEGRVEIYYNHRWGTICNIGWTQTSADVVTGISADKMLLFALTRHVYPGVPSVTSLTTVGMEVTKVIVMIPHLLLLV